MSFPEKYCIAQARTIFDSRSCTNWALAETIIILAFPDPINFLGEPWLKDFEILVFKSQNQYGEDDKTRVSKN